MDYSHNPDQLSFNNALPYVLTELTARIEKCIARQLSAMLAPECGETLAAFRAKRDGWVRMPQALEQGRKNCGLGDAYVLLYSSEASIYSCLLRWASPENVEGFIKGIDEEIRHASPDSLREWIAEFSGDFEAELDALYNLSEDRRGELRRQFESLSDKQKLAETHGFQNLLAFIYAYFYNTLSLMVHGQKMTTLVPLAEQGDKEAFAKAIQIDRNLLSGHPYFKSIHERLLTGEDKKFLDAVLYRLGNPAIRGKIRYPALYMVFATLDSFGWLDDFTAPEILDICDEAKLDRFQNRIEDEGYLNKRRAEYRTYQKLSK